MSDTDDISWVAFVTENGRLIGISEHPFTTGGHAENGLALARLRDAISLVEWSDLINEYEDAESAADYAIGKFGGYRLRQSVPLKNPTIVHRNSGQPIPEA